MINVPAGASKLNINVSSLSGDPDMHVKFGRKPTADDYDCQPRTAGLSENCEPSLAPEGTHYVMITTESRFENAVVSVDYQAGSAACQPDATNLSLLNAHNDARATARSCGNKYYEAVGPLSWSCELGAAALAHSTDMAENNYFEHTGLDGSKPWDRAQRHGYQSGYIGENIAAGQRNVEDVMDGWLESSGHCANIMNGDMTEIGTGLYSKQSSQYNNYWTTLLGRP